MNEWLMQYKYLSLSKTAAFRIYTYNSAYACTHKGKHKLCRHGKAFGCLRKQCTENDNDKKNEHSAQHT
jgi:hypothetical protein